MVAICAKANVHGINYLRDVQRVHEGVLHFRETYVRNKDISENRDVENGRAFLSTHKEVELA